MFRQSRDCPFCLEPMAPVRMDAVFVCLYCDHRELVDADEVACDHCERTVARDHVTYSVRCGTQRIRCNDCSGVCR